MRSVFSYCNFRWRWRFWDKGFLLIWIMATLMSTAVTQKEKLKPYQPQRVTLMVLISGNGEILNSTTKDTVPGTW